MVDTKNTSGLSNDPADPPMIAFWSQNDNKSQGISFSVDHGRTWTMYARNPIFVKPERDPKVFWYEPEHHWVMLLYGGGGYQILTSNDLLHWTDTKHKIPHCFECPDFFQLPLDGDSSKPTWVLINGDGRYSTGTFDATEYVEKSRRFAGDIGPNRYATESWDDAPNGRRAQSARVRSGNFPRMPFNQMISFPCELSLHTVNGVVHMFRKPVAEIDSLHGKPITLTDKTLVDGDALKVAGDGELYDLRTEVEIPPGVELVVHPTENEALSRFWPSGFDRGHPPTTEPANEGLDSARPTTRKVADTFYLKFDRGDVDWLRGYCLLLMGVSDAILAYDEHDLFDRTAQLFFKNPNTPYPFLLSGRKIFEVQGVDFADVVAFVHLLHFPVADAGRMREAQGHFHAMIADSQSSWRAILAEKGDDREWIPNPSQTPAFASLRVDRKKVDAWLRLMDELDAVLAGKRLAPFWRGPDETIGVDVNKVFTDPQTFDPILWISGSGVAPFLAHGPHTDRKVYTDVGDAFGGDLLPFAAWFTGYDSEKNHRIGRLDMGVRTVVPAKIGRPTKAPPTGRFRRLMKRRFARKADATVYGQRAQSETVNSMMKRNMGECLRSIREPRREQEMMLQSLVHNLMVGPAKRQGRD